MNRDVMELYERLRRWIAFNIRYFQHPPWDTGISPPELLGFLRIHPPGRALDLGCGSGTNVLTLAQAGWQVTGVDFALRAVNRARQRLRIANFKADLRVGDVTRLEGITPPFDLVLDIGCLHGLTAQGKAAYMQNLPGLLAAGGTFLVYARRVGAETAAKAGLTEMEIAQLGSLLTLEHRADSLERPGVEAVWLTLRKPD